MKRSIPISMPSRLEVEQLTGNPGPHRVPASAKPRVHNCHEVILVRRGKYHTITGGTPYDVGVGEAIYYPSGCVHNVRFEPEQSREMLRFSWTRPNLGVSTPVKIPDVGGQLAFLINWTIAAARDRSNTANLCLRANAVLEYLRDFLRQQPRTQIDHLLSYLNATISMGITVQKLADAGDMSRSQLCRLFRKELGASPQEVLVRKRMEKARALLVNTDMTVKEIASAVGYSCAQNLAQRFRKHFGITPSACRAGTFPELISP